MRVFIIFLSVTALISVVLNQIMPQISLAKTPEKKTIQAWQDDFNTLNTHFWIIPDRKALEGGYKNVNQGYFKKNNVFVKNGYLVLKLTQEKGKVGNNFHGVVSKGSEIQSFKTYGYGTYEWRMRMSSTSPDPKKTGKSVSGQVSAGFNFIHNSATEIDFEVEGQYPKQLEMTTWENPDASRFPTENDRIYTFKNIPDMTTQFHTYKFIWKPGEITYYVDNILEATHKEDVSSTPAYFMVNHWGTDSTEFGGKATIGTVRYMLIDWVRYTPLVI